MAYDLKTAERVRHLLAERHDVAERKMMGGLLVRVDPEEQPGLITKPHVRPMIMGGRPVSTFVRVMPEGYRTPAALEKWVERGIAAVPAKKAKPARRKTVR